jgi:uncharacterized membrane protein
MAKKQLVMAFYASETAADEAVNKMKQWDKASKEIKLGAIGVLVKDDKGKIKTHKLGKRKTGTGAVLGALAAVLARIDSALDGGKAAVGILAQPDEAAGVSAKLAELGGAPETHEVSDEALEQAEAAVETTPE